MPKIIRIGTYKTTARKELVSRVSNTISHWAHLEATEITGVKREDFFALGPKRLPIPSRRLIEIAVNHATDGAKPGTVGGAMAAEAERMNWDRFVADVRKDVGPRLSLGEISYRTSS